MSIDQVPYLAFAWNRSYATSHDMYVASHKFLIRLGHYSMRIDQIYLLKVS